jgi:hypothetical protein
MGSVSQALINSPIDAASILHDIGAVQLDRDLAYPEVEGDLLAEAPPRHFTQDLAVRQRLQAFDVAPDDQGVGPSRRVERNAGDHRIEQRLVAHRLGEKIDGARLHRLHRHRNITMSSQEDDRLRIAALRQMVLQVKAARPRHAHVKDQAAGAVQYVGVGHFTGRGETHRLKARREDQLRHGLANGRIVIDDDDDGLTCVILVLPRQRCRSPEWLVNSHVTPFLDF